MTTATQTRDHDMDATDLPETLNGYPVLDIAPRQSKPGMFAIVVERPHRLHPFVVATWWSDLGDRWEWGTYCATYAEAVTEFEARAGN